MQPQTPARTLLLLGCWPHRVRESVDEKAAATCVHGSSILTSAPRFRILAPWHFCLGLGLQRGSCNNSCEVS